MISGAAARWAPGVAPSGTAPSFIRSTSSTGDSLYRPPERMPSGDLLEKRRFAAERTDDRQLQGLAEQFARATLQVVGGHGIDLGDGLVDVLDVVGQGFLSAVPGGNGVGAFHLQQQTALVELPRLGQLSLADGLIAEPVELADDGAHRPRRLSRLGAGVDLEHAGVEHLVNV